MTHELFQNYPALGAFSGMTTPFGLTNPALQAFGINPTLGLNPQIPGGLQNPLQTSIFQNPLVAASLQNPLIAACLQNPALAAALQNPLLAASLQDPLPYGQQQHSPYFQDRDRSAKSDLNSRRVDRRMDRLVLRYGQIGLLTGRSDLNSRRVGRRMDSSVLRTGRSALRTDSSDLSSRRVDRRTGSSVLLRADRLSTRAGWIAVRAVRFSVRISDLNPRRWIAYGQFGARTDRSDRRTGRPARHSDRPVLRSLPRLGWAKANPSVRPIHLPLMALPPLSHARVSPWGPTPWGSSPWASAPWAGY